MGTVSDERGAYSAEFDILERLKELVDQEVAIITLVQGARTDGSPFWAYVAIPPSRYEAFKKAEATGAYRLNDYGAILRSGEGQEPPGAVRQEMMDKYGADESFEVSLIEAMGPAPPDQNKA